jgi:hypothetical protein
LCWRIDQETLDRDGRGRLFANLAQHACDVIDIVGFTATTGQQPESAAVVDEYFEDENLTVSDDGSL